MVDAYHSNSLMKVFEEELAHINGVSSTGLTTGSGLDEQPALPPRYYDPSVTTSLMALHLQ